MLFPTTKGSKKKIEKKLLESNNWIYTQPYKKFNLKLALNYRKYYVPQLNSFSISSQKKPFLVKKYSVSTRIKKVVCRIKDNDNKMRAARFRNKNRL